MRLPPMEKLSKSEICKQLIETARGRLIVEIQSFAIKLSKNKWIKLDDIYSVTTLDSADYDTQFYAVQNDKILVDIDNFTYYLMFEDLSNNELIKILEFLEKENFKVVNDKYFESEDYQIFMNDIGFYD